MRATLATVTLALALPACAARVTHPIPVALLVDGDRAALGAIPKYVSGLELHEIALPAPPAQATHGGDAAATIARARSSYARGDLDACRSELSSIDVASLLAAGDPDDRALAARAIAYDAGCAWAGMAKTDAAADAARLASYGLDLPEAAIAPDVEALVGAAITAAGRARRHPLTVTGQIGARLVVDGRAGGCALPCTVDLAPGDHVIAVEADGFSPAMQRVRTPDLDHLALVQQAAPAELAARQWRARVGRGQPAADAVGAALIGRFAGDARVAFVHGEAQALSGALVVDGKLVAADAGARGETARVVRTLAYDGGVLHRPSVYQRPWFWIAVSGAVLVVAGGVFAATYTPPPPHTSAGF